MSETQVTEDLIALNKANDITPEEVGETSVDPLDTPEVNQAAAQFNQIIPQIKSHTRTMSLNQLRRVMIAFSEFPLGSSYPKFVSKKEDELFMMMLHADGVKSVMKSAVLQSQGAIKEIYEKTVSEVAKEELKSKLTKGE